MNIKVKDTVIVQSGKNKGKTGKVTQVLPKEDLIVVDGVNKMFKHIRPQKKGDKGQRIEFFGPLKTAKVMLVCPKCNKTTRVKINIEGKNKKRQCRKCEAIIE